MVAQMAPIAAIARMTFEYGSQGIVGPAKKVGPAMPIPPLRADPLREELPGVLVQGGHAAPALPSMNIRRLWPQEIIERHSGDSFEGSLAGTLEVRRVSLVFRGLGS